MSGLFFMLTLAAYVSYARRPFSLVRYLTVVALFALGLMAKPMLVTLPFVLLLLDYWPLRRFAAGGQPIGSRASGFPTGSRPPARELAIGVPQRELGNEVHSTVAWRLVIEKLPLLALSAASCVVTPLVQAKTVARLDFIPLWSRIANALVSYVAYARQLFFPGLGVFYPHPGATLPLWKAAGARCCWPAFPLPSWPGDGNTLIFSSAGSGT